MFVTRCLQYFCYAFVFALFLPAALLAQAPPTASANPPKSWVDPSTGHKVIRITDEPNSASFYFNVNSYTPDGTEMVYTTPDGISVMDLATWKSHAVVHGKVHTIVVGHKTPSVFYIKTDEHALYVTNVAPGVTRKLATIPERGSIASVNADETLAAGTYIEGNGGEARTAGRLKLS